MQEVRPCLPAYLCAYGCLANGDGVDCSTKEDAKRYFEVSIYRKHIGRGLAALYLAWAAHCQSMGLVEDAVKALQLVRLPHHRRRHCRHCRRCH